MKGGTTQRTFVFLSIILLIAFLPPVNAELSTNQTVLNAICVDDSTCQLTNTITGINEIKNSETSASPLSPEIRSRSKIGTPSESPPSSCRYRLGRSSGRGCSLTLRDRSRTA